MTDNERDPYGLRQIGRSAVVGFIIGTSIVLVIGGSMMLVDWIQTR